MAKGMKMPLVCWKLGGTEQTYYRWRTEYGGVRPIRSSGSRIWRRRTPGSRSWPVTDHAFGSVLETRTMCVRTTLFVLARTTVGHYEC